MKKTFTKLLLIASILLISIGAMSQTIINYQTWTGASGCNIFGSATNVPATLNGSNVNVAHLTAIGQPYYDAANSAVGLDARVNGSQNEGTEYRITYTFKKDYTYKITVSAARIMSVQQGSNVLLRLDMNSGGSGNNTTCNGMGSIDASGSGNLKKSLAIVDGNFNNYVFDYIGMSAQQSFLMVAAIPPASSVLQYLLIRKITIEETAPAASASFSISPATSTLACGATTPIAFTINNNGGTTGITNYTWNLGTAPNGWLLPNGTPAPATYSTGVTNTLTLTPDCGKALSSISATVTANGNNYNTTNSASVSITQPSYSISGNSSVCSGSTNYTINGLVCNSSITWTPPPANFASLSSLTTSPTTLTYGGTSGSFTLTANVTSCNVATPVTLPLRVGPYTGADYTFNVNGTISGIPLYWCPNQNYTFILGGNTASNYSWSVPTGWTMLYNGGYMAVLKSPPGGNPPTGSVSVTFTEPCGTQITANKQVIYSTNGCSGNGIYTVSPSPASTNITIACASLQTYCNIAAVQITDMYGNVLSSQSWPYTNQQVQMPVHFMQNGPKIARIYSGTQWFSVQFTVQH